MSVNHERYHEYSKARLLLQSFGYVVLTNAEYEAIGEANATIDALSVRIAELEAATRPIPVTERLPDDGVRVIVFDTTLERVGIARHVAQVPQWATDDGVFYHNDSYGWITHWQPLSPPPEVKS